MGAAYRWQAAEQSTGAVEAAYIKLQLRTTGRLYFAEFCVKTSDLETAWRCNSLRCGHGPPSVSAVPDAERAQGL